MASAVRFAAATGRRSQQSQAVAEGRPSALMAYKDHERDGRQQQRQPCSKAEPGLGRRRWSVHRPAELALRSAVKAPPRSKAAMLCRLPIGGQHQQRNCQCGEPDGDIDRKDPAPSRVLGDQPADHPATGAASQPQPQSTNPPHADALRQARSVW